MALKIIVISGPIGFDVTVSDVRNDLDDANGADVEMHIASPGGFVSPGLEIFNLIRDYPGNIDFKVMGQVASMGSYILMARAGRGKIRVHDNTVFMMHKPATFAGGNDDELEKIFKHMRGLTKILALGYAVKSGKTKEKMIELMKDVTFYYGSEIVDAGFADEVIVTDNNDNKDKATAIIEAQASIENCVAMMRDSEFAKEDTFKAAAYMKEHPIDNKQGKKPDAENKINNSEGSKENLNNEEENKMNLKELLAKDPEAKADFNIALATAKKAGVDEVKATIKKVVPIMLSEDYSPAVKALGGKVLEGTEEVASFTAVVTIETARVEEIKAEAAAKENGKETPGGPGTGATSEDGAINNMEDFAAAEAKIKAEKEVK